MALLNRSSLFYRLVTLVWRLSYKTWNGNGTSSVFQSPSPIHLKSASLSRRRLLLWKSQNQSFCFSWKATCRRNPSWLNSMKEINILSQSMTVYIFLFRGFRISEVKGKTEFLGMGVTNHKKNWAKHGGVFNEIWKN